MDFIPGNISSGLVGPAGGGAGGGVSGGGGFGFGDFLSGGGSGSGGGAGLGGIVPSPRPDPAESSNKATSVVIAKQLSFPPRQVVLAKPPVAATVAEALSPSHKYVHHSVFNKKHTTPPALPLSDPSPLVLGEDENNSNE